ncbi:hypothetical protein [uncultured Aquimarina sp.]|uniref:hypothetical protein n=1 Tax=uncultured Aquimarina sp. TaxID=575652 RepID=UPI00262F23EA|nr:hypothetical protein [uncultured Aquimarina sp.]
MSAEETRAYNIIDVLIEIKNGNSATNFNTTVKTTLILITDVDASDGTNRKINAIWMY